MVLRLKFFFLYFVIANLNFQISSQNVQSDDINETLQSVDKRGTFTLSSVRPDRPQSLKVFQRMMRDAHNDLRSSEGSSDMVRMQYDRGLIDLAQAVADTCVFKHSTKVFKEKYSKRWNYIGENIWLGYRVGHKEPQNIVKAWYNEKRNYNYETASCSHGICGHYTQVVWAESRFLGCGIRFCSSVKMPSGKTWTDAYYVVCEYGPGGNKGKQKPYSKGHPCEKCPSYCVDGKMCRKFVAAAKRATVTTEHENTVKNFLEQLKRFIKREKQN